MRKRSVGMLVAVAATLAMSLTGAGAATIKCYHPAGQPGGNTYDPDTWLEKRLHVDVDVLPGPYAVSSSDSQSLTPEWKICIDETPGS